MEADEEPRGGIRGWLLSNDNTRLGVLWLGAALLFFYAGGLLAVAMRTELSTPEADVFDADAYAGLFTLHGTFMIFFFAVVVYFGLGSILIPPVIGARQMAFPRLNALDFWLILLGGLVLEVAYLFGESPTAGWTSYTPLSLAEHSPGRGQDWWLWAVGIETLGGTLAGVNFAVTILHERKPGLRLSRMPLVAWGFLAASLLVAVAGPFLLTALGFLFLDRNFGTTFFDAASRGGTLLWQDLFWFYSHPATYVMILPGFGIVSTILMRFSRRRLLSRGAVIGALGAITVLGLLVWWHHMFVTGLSDTLRVFAGAMSWSIALPTGLIVFVWLASMWGARLRLTTPALFALGFVLMLTLGGADGLYMAYVAFDTYAHSTYWLVAHFHYIIFGGTVLGVFAGIYYWFPAALHRQLDERLGKWHFWGTFVGMNLLFFPMHFAGLAGMRRRVHAYPPELAGLNVLETAGMYVVAAAMGIFLVNVLLTLLHGRLLAHDPWDSEAEQAG